MAPTATFYSIFMEDVGYSKTLIGQLWRWEDCRGAGISVYAPLATAVWRACSSITSLLLAALRWILIGNFPASCRYFCAQLLHAATSELFMLRLFTWFTTILQASGSGTGSTVASVLVPEALGSLLSGYLWNTRDRRLSSAYPR